MQIVESFFFAKNLAGKNGANNTDFLQILRLGFFHFFVLKNEFFKKFYSGCFFQPFSIKAFISFRKKDDNPYTSTPQFHSVDHTQNRLFVLGMCYGIFY